MCKLRPTAPRLSPAASRKITLARTTVRYGAPNARARRSSSACSSGVSSMRKGDFSRMPHEAANHAGTPIFYRTDPVPMFWGAVLRRWGSWIPLVPLVAFVALVALVALVAIPPWRPLIALLSGWATECVVERRL